eukprot:1175892-Prorocentrum_minimum.AAC.1
MLIGTGRTRCVQGEGFAKRGAPESHGQWPRGGLEGIYRSCLDARKPQNPINSEEYLWHLQGVLYIV